MRTHILLFYVVIEMITYVPLQGTYDGFSCFLYITGMGFSQIYLEFWIFQPENVTRVNQ